MGRLYVAALPFYLHADIYIDLKPKHYFKILMLTSPGFIFFFLKEASLLITKSRRLRLVHNVTVFRDYRKPLHATLGVFANSIELIEDVYTYR